MLSNLAADTAAIAAPKYWNFFLASSANLALQMQGRVSFPRYVDTGSG